MVLASPIADKDSSDYLIKMVSARFLHCKVIFSIVIEKSIVDYFDHKNILFLIYLCLLILISIYDSCLDQLLLWCY